MPVPLRARLLSNSSVQAAGVLSKGAGELALSELLIEVPDLPQTIPAAWLASGRWPTPGSDEVVAGAQTTSRPDLTVNGRWFTIVGVLRLEAQSVARCYLLASNRPNDDLFQPTDSQVRQAYLVTLPRTDADRTKMVSIRTAFAAAHFVEISSTTPIARALFYF